MQPGIATQPAVGQQLTFELKGGLFRGQQNQRRAAGIFPEGRPDFGQAAKGLAAAGGTEKKTHMHAGLFAQSRGGGKQFIAVGLQIFGSYLLFPFELICLCLPPVGKIRIQRRKQRNHMPLTHTRELFAKALKGKYALGAFNVNNMELLQAIIEACEEEKAPVMLQISKGARQYANPVYLKKLIEAAVSLSTIPIAVHLDHGDTFELCKECIDEGFTSVMIDASHEPFEKNVEITRKVVDYAHKHNCVVESELGHLVGAQFDEGEEGGAHSVSGHYTIPEEAVKFVQESGCDSLAVAIGNSHGAYKFKGTQHLDLERLKLIKKALMDAGLGDYPLVLHGASSVPKELAEEINKYGGKLGTDTAGVPEADIEVARRTGCTKVNIDTDLRLAMTAAIRKVMSENPKEFDPRKYLGPARNKVKDLVRHKIKDVLCCAGHAFD
jgi:fructose-bisphosphate aldolase class II